MAKMVADVEGRKAESLGDCLNWVRGLLKDFIALRKRIQEFEMKPPMVTKGSHKPKNYLSPINKDSVCSIAVDNSSTAH